MNEVSSIPGRCVEFVFVLLSSCFCQIQDSFLQFHVPRVKRPLKLALKVTWSLEFFVVKVEDCSASSTSANYAKPETSSADSKFEPFGGLPHGTRVPENNPGRKKIPGGFNFLLGAAHT